MGPASPLARPHAGLRTRLVRLRTRQRVLLALAPACLLALGWLRWRPPPDRPVDGAEPWLRNLEGGGDGTIAVIMPCFKQRAFVAEALRSIAAQTYPAASITVVDDASPDGCAEEATRVLEELRPRRDAQRAALVAWLQLPPAAAARLRDEVLTTRPPGRGVAAARNRAIGLATAEWVCCVDADDLLRPTYFELAMREVVADPRLNLVYANQQFFGESTWRWDVPEWSPQGAVASGPLPVSSVMRRSLWAATPHGFDEAQPRGHEDWSLWLQLVRLPVRAHKLPNFLLLYRFRASSKKRTREARNPEVPRLLRTLYPDLYPPRALLDDHAALLAVGLTPEVLADTRAARARTPERSSPALWLGMHHEHLGAIAEAAREYSAAVETRALYDWQPLLRLACAAARQADAQANGRACDGLARVWSAEQLRWYMRPDEPATTFAKTAEGAAAGVCCALPAT
ncbi:nucleotide-diphospho-sugar transferase [Pavlovales sp. CCMP2436]|nr:nucleotide-diphospho-sugar transferase [Pavlovales sp. CCMP2436]